MLLTLFRSLRIRALLLIKAPSTVVTFLVPLATGRDRRREVLVVARVASLIRFLVRA